MILGQDRSIGLEITRINPNLPCRIQQDRKGLNPLLVGGNGLLAVNVFQIYQSRLGKAFKPLFGFGEKHPFHMSVLVWSQGCSIHQNPSGRLKIFLIVSPVAGYGSSRALLPFFDRFWFSVKKNPK